VSGVLEETTEEVPVRIALLCILAAAIVAPAAAGDGGPSPGISDGWDGVVAPGGKVRYVTVSTGPTTIVEAILVRSGRVESYRVLPGSYGVPLVAYDGQAGGLSHDGKTLVLSTWPGSTPSRFAVVNTKSFRLRQIVTLRGVFSFDAISPDGSTLYLIQFTDAQNYQRYRVRAYDLETRRLVAGAIVDRREPDEAMTGQPVTRVTSASGRWVYTLYARQQAAPFVHALDSAERQAYCIDLRWKGSQNALWKLRMRLTPDGSKIVLRGKNRTIVVEAPGRD
jgi:hypothetical protein